MSAGSATPAAHPQLLGLGFALPPTRFDRTAAERALALLCPPPGARRGAWAALLSRSGVEARRSAVVRVGDDTLSSLSTGERMALFAEHAPPLAQAAATQALQRSGVEADAITHLFSVSCTGQAAPGLGVGLARGLSLSPDLLRCDVTFMGCHGAFVALRQAQAAVRADARAVALVVAVELCTLHVQPRFRQAEAVAQALFGDGAAAAVVGDRAASSAQANASSAQPPIDHGDVPAPALRPSPWSLLATGSRLLPHGADLLTWDLSETGFRVGLDPRLPDVVADSLRSWLEPWLAAQGLGLHDIGSFAVHPGGPRILSAVQGALELSPQQLQASRDVLSEFGNMSSPTVLFVLERLTHAPRPCLALGMGPGPSFEVALLG